MTPLSGPRPGTEVSERTGPRVAVRLSVVVPVTERAEPLDELYRAYAGSLQNLGEPFEFIVVAEPWAREHTATLASLVAEGHPIRVLEVSQPMGETALVRLAVSECRGSIVVTIPSYYRVDPRRLIELARRVEAGVDLAIARRWPRQDSLVNRLQNRVFHFLLHTLVGGRLNDVACGVQAMRREVLEGVPLYGDFFRFLPLLAVREGYRVEEVLVEQHQRDRSARVYSPGTYLRRLIDVFGLYFLLRFTEKPLRFFGLIGSGLVIIGAAILLLLLIQRLAGEGIADRPLLLLGNLTLVLGVQAVALGLIGEIIVHLHASGRPSYRLKENGTQATLRQVDGAPSPRLAKVQAPDERYALKASLEGHGSEPE